MSTSWTLRLCASVCLVVAACTPDVASTRAPLVDDAGSFLSETDRSTLAPPTASIDTEVDRAIADQERGYATWRAGLQEGDRLAEARFDRDGVGFAGSQLMFEWSARHTVTSLWSRRLRLPVPSGADPTGRALAFVVDRGALFGALTGETLVAQGADHYGTETVVRFTQAAAGLPVFGAGANKVDPILSGSSLRHLIVLE